jgi:branched-chain amino acid transport system substrate-binding protein
MLGPMGGRLRAMAVVAAASVTIAACTDSGSPAPTTTTTTPATTAPERFARGDPDGVLTIGVLLPRTGAGATLGQPLIDVITAAVQTVNLNGGVAGRDVELQVFDEAAPASVDDLLDDQSIDAVIGPASSRNALAMLPTITDAGVAACSPTATSIALTDLPDHGLFFRTVPSDALQARAIAQRINQTGLGSTALVYTDDVYGRPFAAAVRNALGGLALPVTMELAYRPDDEDFSEEAAGILAAAPPAVAMIGDAESGGRMVAAILAAGGASSPTIIANDAIRLADFGTRIDVADLAKRVTGVSVSAYEGQQELAEAITPENLATVAFAAAAVDCVNLLALGAVAAGTPDDPGRIVAEVLELSVGGVPCDSFVECRQPMEDGRDVDYDGPTGQLALDGTGDVTRATFEVYGFDTSGTDVDKSSFSFPG